MIIACLSRFDILNYKVSRVRMVEHLDISCPKVGKKHFIYIHTVGVFNCAVYS